MLCSRDQARPAGLAEARGHGRERRIFVGGGAGQRSGHQQQRRRQHMSVPWGRLASVVVSVGTE